MARDTISLTAGGVPDAGSVVGVVVPLTLTAVPVGVPVATGFVMPLHAASIVAVTPMATAMASTLSR